VPTPTATAVPAAAPALSTRGLVAAVLLLGALAAFTIARLGRRAQR